MAMAAHTASLLPSRRVALQREPSLSASARGVREARARPTFLGLGSRQPWRSVEGLGCGVCGEQAPLRAAVLKAGTSLTNGRRCSRVRATAIEGQQAEPGGSSPAGGDDGPEGSSTGGSPGGPGSQRMGAQQAPQSSNGTALPLNPFTPGKLSSRVAAKGGAAGGEQELKGLSPPSNSPSAPSAASVVGESLSPPPSSAETKSRSPFAPPTTLPSPQSPQSPFGSPPGKAFQAPKREDPLSALKGTSPKPAVGSIRPNPSFAGGKKLLEAFKEDKFENKVKPGQPRAPANIFDDPRRTAEEIEAEKWRFSLDSGQILLILSFFASSMLMFATVWVVWKLGAIHFDEY